MSRAIALLAASVLVAAGCGGEEAEGGQCHYAGGESREGIASDAKQFVDAALDLRGAADKIDEDLLQERRAFTAALAVDTEVADDQVDTQIVEHLAERARGLAKLGCTFAYKSDFDPKSDSPFGSKTPDVSYAIQCDAPDAKALAELVSTHLPKVLEGAAQSKRLLPQAKALCDRAPRLLRQKEASEEMASYAEVKCAADDMCAFATRSPLAFAGRLVDAATGK